MKTQRYVLVPYAGGSTRQTVQFWSRQRQVTAKQIGNMWDFVERFLVEQDAFDPSIDSKYLLGSAYCLKRGVRYRVQNPGFILVLPDGRKVTSVPDLVRVDYFRFGTICNWLIPQWVKSTIAHRNADKCARPKVAISLPRLSLQMLGFYASTQPTKGGGSGDRTCAACNHKTLTQLGYIPISMN